MKDADWSDGSEGMVQSGSATDETEAEKGACDGFLKEFDSVVVQQIDFRFQEIMCQKKDGNTSGESGRKSRHTKRCQKQSNCHSGGVLARKGGSGRGLEGGSLKKKLLQTVRVSFEDDAKEDEEKGEATAEKNFEEGVSRLAFLDSRSASESSSPDRLIHHPRLDYTRHGFNDHQHPHPHPGHHLPSNRYPDPWGQGHKGHMYSSGSNTTTFEEVESLCLSRSSNDSSSLYKHQQLMNNLPRPGLGNGLGPHHGQFRNGRHLSRQNSGTSTSTSSGVLHEAADSQLGSGGSSGPPQENSKAGTFPDPRQQFDFSDHAFLDGMFRRVLEWNQAYAAMAMGREGSGGPFSPRSSSPLRSSPGRFAAVPPGTFPPPGFCQLPPECLRPRSASPVPPMPGNGSSPQSGPAQAGRRRGPPDSNKEKTMSPTSDITHVKKRRDLILPDEEDEFSFSRPSYSSRKPEVKARIAVTTHAGYTPTRSSLKQASSESMLSSMSSMSQSQDMGWREQFNHDWREAQHAIWREQADQGLGDPYVNPWRRTDPSQQMWREPLFHPPPPSHPPPSSARMMPPQMPGRGLNRGMSIESMTSLGMVSPPESYYGSSSQNPAEMMLMNLGFGGSAEGFLPERFLRDWYSKISHLGQYPVNPPRPSDNGASPYDSTYSPLGSHGARAPLPSKPSYKDLRSASDLHRRIGQPFNQSVVIPASQVCDPPETPTSLLPPSLGKESRSDRLKEYIEAYAQNMSNTTDARSVKIRQFACSRQKSLPSYLETLTEEEEVKSRSSWQKPQDGECRLQAFLREDSLSTASGQSDSQCTTSGGGSNYHSLMGSESDSLSGSDHVDYNQRMSQRRGVSCEQSVSAPYSQPVPIASRVLKLKMPNPAERRARLKSDSRNVDDEEVLPEAENQSQNRSLIHITSCTPEKTEQQQWSQTSDNQHMLSQREQDRETHRSCRSKSPNRFRSPKKRKNPGSPRHKSESLIKTKSTLGADSIIITEEECSGCIPVDRNCHGSLTPGCIDRNRLFVSHIPMESPVRRCHNSLYPQSTSILQTDFSQGAQSQGAQTQENCDGVLNRDHSDSLVSTESLEIADIFHNSGQTTNALLKERSVSKSEGGSAGIGGQGLVEPAMVSIVLEDVDGNLTDNLDSCDQHHQQPSEEEVQQDDFLQIPSCSPSTSLSPIPLSPVTVIEVSLDNQQDSIDTEDSFGSSKDHNDDEDETCDYENQAVQQICDCEQNETNYSEFSEGNERACGNEFSYSLPLSSDRSVKGGWRESGGMCDAYVDADDGSASPILLFSTVSPQTSTSSSPSVTALASKLSDAEVQADDGMLSPLAFLSQDDLLSDLIHNDCAEDLYLVSDQAIQSKDTDPDMDSGIIDSPTSSCLMSHDEELSAAELIQEEDLNQAFINAASIDDFCDKDFTNTEEARVFILSRFLLRGSDDSQSVKVNNKPETTSDSLSHVSFMLVILLSTYLVMMQQSQHKAVVTAEMRSTIECSHLTWITTNSTDLYCGQAILMKLTWSTCRGKFYHLSLMKKTIQFRQNCVL
ncbi:hypothetical protein ACOMHN_031029 [Nucella lapillus]